MTISSTVRVAGPYSGNDATVTFSFAFKVFAAADVQVILTDSADTESVLTLTTDYTVTLNGNQDTNPGGSVTLLVAPATGEKLTVTSDQASYQSVSLANQGGFYPEVINNQLDKLAINIQQCERDIALAARVPLSSDIDPDIVSDALITVATSIGDVETVAGSIGDVGTVATNIANVNFVGGDIANVNSVAGDLANIDAVAGDLSNVDIVAADIADVSTCADNIVLIQSAPANAASASASASAASASASLALAANEAAEAAASASGDVLFYDTKADADAALSGLSENQIVEVMADEEVSGLRTRYRVETGAYAFKIIVGEGKVLTVAALRAIPYSAMLTTAQTLGCVAAGDGGGGLWRWDATVLAATPDNTGTIVKPTGHTGDGAWVRDYDGPVHVTWFGADSTGAADSRAAFVKALVFTAVHVPAGTYSISNYLALLSGTRLTGDGKNRSKLVYTATFPAGDPNQNFIRSALSEDTTLEDIEICNIWFEHSGLGNQTVGGFTLFFPNINNLTVEDCKFTEFNTGFIQVNGRGTEGTIKGYNIAIRNNEAYGRSDYIPTVGIQVYEGFDVDISHNYFELISRPVSLETTVFDGFTAWQLEDVLIANNIIVDAATSTESGTNVAKCIYCAGMTAFAQTQYVRDLTIVGNLIRDSGSPTVAAAAGISLDYCLNATVANNVMSNTGKIGVSVGTSCDKITVTGNAFDCRAESLLGYQGIVTVAATNVQIIGNSFRGQFSNDISVQTTSDYIVVAFNGVSGYGSGIGFADTNKTIQLFGNSSTQQADVRLFGDTTTIRQYSGKLWNHYTKKADSTYVRREYLESGTDNVVHYFENNTTPSVAKVFFRAGTAPSDTLCLYVNSADNKLYYKDNAGVANALY